MIKEYQMISKNRYIYETYTGDIYVLDEKVPFTFGKGKEQKYYDKLIAYLETHKIYKVHGYNRIPKSIMKKDSHNVRNFMIGFITGLSVLIAGPILKQYFKNYQANQELKTLEKNITTIGDTEINELLLQIKEVIKKQGLADEIYDEVIFENLFRNFSSNQEAFLYYIKNSINQNESLTQSEKTELIKEYERMIQKYGNYYNGLSILNALIQLENAPVSHDFEKAIETYQMPNDKNTLYNSSNNSEAIEALHHEMSHLEDKNLKSDHIVFYREAKATLLSKAGSSDALLVIETLCKIAGKESILPGLINRNYDLIWENVKNSVNAQESGKVDLLQGMLEHMNVADVYNVEKYQEIYKVLNELYKSKYGYDIFSSQPEKEHALIRKIPDQTEI